MESIFNSIAACPATWMMMSVVGSSSRYGLSLKLTIEAEKEVPLIFFSPASVDPSAQTMSLPGAQKISERSCLCPCEKPANSPLIVVAPATSIGICFRKKVNTAGKVSKFLERAALLPADVTTAIPGYLMFVMIFERKSHSGGRCESSTKVRSDVLGYTTTAFFWRDFAMMSSNAAKNANVISCRLWELFMITRREFLETPVFQPAALEATQDPCFCGSSSDFVCLTLGP